jgi:phospholipase B1, membrane-associated
MNDPHKLFMLLAFSFYSISSAIAASTIPQAYQVLFSDPKYAADFNEHQQLVKQLEPNYYNYSTSRNNFFKCRIQQSKCVPDSVHRLRPSDIKVVAALGDSVTAGFATDAQNLIQLVFESRGRPFAIGGAESLEQRITLPNLLKKFNPDLVGFSLGSNLPETPIDQQGLNVAVSGAIALNMTEQAMNLVARIKADPKIDIQKDWKMVTMFIGANDLCAYCLNKQFFSPSNYVSFIKSALDILYKELPRTFVNLLAPVDVTFVKNLNKGLVCSHLHRFQCPCGAYPESVQAEQELKDIFNQYFEQAQQFINSGVYDRRQDFTVVYQPFFKNNNLPSINGEPDYSYFAMDCFHFSAKAYATVTVSLWNNMFQPVGKKRTEWTLDEKLICPNPGRPYIFTRLNSRLYD